MDILLYSLYYIDVQLNVFIFFVGLSKQLTSLLAIYYSLENSFDWEACNWFL